MMELVCPAGTPAALRAAVEAGAHAVYCGFADETNARNFPGLNFSREQFASVTSIDHAAWTEELKLHSELFTTLEYHLPEALKATKAKLEAALAA